MLTPITDSLSPRDQLILVDYIKDFNAAACSRRTGVPVTTVRSLVGSVAGQDAIAEQMSERIERTKVDADWMLQQLADMFSADIADLIDPQTGAVLPVHLWPPVWRRMTSGFDQAELKTFAYLGDAPAESEAALELLTGVAKENNAMTHTQGMVKKLRFIDRLKVLELIGKHTDVRAFTERVELATDMDLNERLRRGRARVSEKADKLSFI